MNDDGMKTVVIGLTGGIGSGKSLVSDTFASLGVHIVDADVIAREVVAPGQPALEAIAAHFGQDILLPNGQLNRAALRQKVFSQPEEKAWLDNYLHPLIRHAMVQQLKQGESSYSILSVPLLLENGLDSMVDSVLVVDCEEETQLYRAMNRDNNDASTIKNIMAAQIDRSSRLQKADDVIDNNGGIEATKKQVLKLHEKYLTLI